MPALSSTTSARSSAPRRTRLLALLIAVSAVRQAHALADETPRSFHIERAPLEHVLLEIARVSGLHVSFASGVVKERWAGPIDGKMSAQEAARRALQGSGLTLASLPDGTLTVVASDQAEAPPNVGTLAATEVHGEAGDGFAVFSTGAISRVEMAVSNVPHAVSMLSGGLLASRQSPTLSEAVSQAGVVPVLVDQAAPPQYAIRGFMTDTISVDGLPDRLASMRPMEALDEIAVIKGPNADVAGVTMAGGTINASLKAPGAAPMRSIAVETGSHAERKVIADLGGAIGTNGLIYRVVGVQDASANSDAGHTGRRTSYGHGALGWSDANTEAIIGVETLASRQPVQPSTFVLNGGVVRLPSLSPLGNADDDVQGRAERFYYTLSHSLTDDWAVHSRGSYENLRLQSAQWHLMPSADGSAPMPTVGMGYRSDNRVWALSSDLTGTIRQGLLTHSLVVGWDEIQDRLDFHYPGATVLGQQNPYVPTPLPSAEFVPGLSLSQTVRQSVFRLRDRIAIGERWELSASIRANDYVAKLPHARLQGLAWTPAFGVVYKLDARTSWFADYSHGFQINTGYFYNGATMQPERSQQVETGLRWEDRQRKLTAQLALYHIDANHVGVGDTAHPGYYTEITEQSSDGIELSLQGSIARGWETSLWLSGAHVKRRLPGNPSFTAPGLGGAMWTMYTVQSGTLAGAGAGLGVTAQRWIPCYDTAPFRVPGFVQLDGSLFWRSKQWRIDLIARNLFTVRAYGNTVSSSFVPILPGRTLTLRLARNF
ncbi:ligand-gated channel [Ralstonia solanacearum]|uniref:Outer membrane receptor protein n=1 Tax=Ralstonia solanacearum TaxID=305 RepID=A0A0S4UCQ1_RALSL|nr:TonB-dependent receptor [Ralstonia pseudosolanacearum]NKA05647.1 TonB-dependent receptor [Ralstonia solanacearum]OIT11866.1 ligand-gated channel [Ralstonia solanacearum]QKL64187.1 TonB-dependent receptor [Ralstonia solanacearum]QKL68995.1 TonB-dependent receptor [Ralstonia solanacearum]